MSEHMAAQMDRQIEGAISENERLCLEVDYWRVQRFGAAQDAARYSAERDEARAQAEANAKDAARWRKLRSMVSGWRALGSGRPAAFKFPGAMELPPVTEDIMKGSVAQHLDAAIDAAMTARTPMPIDEVPLPDPFDWCYEWDGPYGTRKFSAASHNGAKPARSVALFNEERLRAYGDARAAAAVAAERERWSDAVRALMCGDLGVQTRHKLEDGHGVDTEDGKAWLRALRMLSEDTRPAADDLAAKENP